MSQALRKVSFSNSIVWFLDVDNTTYYLPFLLFNLFWNHIIVSKYHMFFLPQSSTSTIVSPPPIEYEMRRIEFRQLGLADSIALEIIFDFRYMQQHLF